MAGDRLIMERFANITDGSVIGIRAPYLRIGGNTQFQMMNDQFFVYDSSITAPLSRIPGLKLFITFIPNFMATFDTQHVHNYKRSTINFSSTIPQSHPWQYGVISGNCR